MTPDTFLARLCALVPPPRAHTVLYYGVLSAHHALRSAVVPCAEEPEPAPKQLSLFIPRGQLELPAITTLLHALSEMKCEKAGMEEYGKRQERAAGAPGSCRRVSSEAEPVRAEPFQGKTRCDRGRRPHRVQLSGTPRRARCESDALVERDSVGCGRSREEQELSDRRGPRRRPSSRRAAAPAHAATPRPPPRSPPLARSAALWLRRGSCRRSPCVLAPFADGNAQPLSTLTASSQAKSHSTLRRRPPCRHHQRPGARPRQHGLRATQKHRMSLPG